MDELKREKIKRDLQHFVYDVNQFEPLIFETRIIKMSELDCSLILCD